MLDVKTVDNLVGLKVSVMVVYLVGWMVCEKVGRMVLRAVAVTAALKVNLKVVL
jgi:hypothetical protein